MTEQLDTMHYRVLCVFNRGTDKSTTKIYYVTSLAEAERLEKDLDKNMCEVLNIVPDPISYLRKNYPELSITNKDVE